MRLKAELETVLTARPAQDWEDELNRIGVPSGAVLSLPEVLAHPQITERGLLARFDDTPGLDRAIDLMRIGAMIDGARPSVDTPPPALGVDTTAILAELGYTEAEIDEMQSEGVT